MNSIRKATLRIWRDMTARQYRPQPQRDMTGLSLEGSDEPTVTDRPLPPVEQVLGRKPTAADLPYLLALGYNVGLTDAGELLSRHSLLDRKQRAELQRKERNQRIDDAYACLTSGPHRE